MPTVAPVTPPSETLTTARSAGVAVEPVRVGAPGGGPEAPASVAAMAVSEPQWRGVARRRFWGLNLSHAVIDIFPIFTTTMMLVLEDRLHLTAKQIGVVYMITPIFSGGLQPFFAWLTDRYDTRVCAPLGLLLGAACLSSMGLAQNFWQLCALIIVGVIGTGMYHPIGAALAGQIGGRAHLGRGWALALFFAAGMVGQALGPIISSRINAAYGLTHLLWLVPPSAVVAVGLFFLLRRVPHRHDNHREMTGLIAREERSARWVAVWLLGLQNCLRFIVNIGALVMFNVWAASKIPTSPALAAKLSGNLAAAMTVGMGVFGLLVGRYVRQGDEKKCLIVVSLVGAVFMGALSAVGDWGVSTAGGAWWGYWPAYLMACLCAIGFGSTIPLSISLAQRLLPGNTGLASSLMMGAGWAVSALAPVIAPVFLGASIKEAPGLPAWRIDVAFACFGALLLGSAALTSMMSGKTLRGVADHR